MTLGEGDGDEENGVDKEDINHLSGNRLQGEAELKTDSHVLFTFRNNWPRRIK